MRMRGGGYLNLANTKHQYDSNILHPTIFADGAVAVYRVWMFVVTFSPWCTPGPSIFYAGGGESLN